ncbi:alpha/beta hydrolase [Polaribacter sp. IC063]|nr:alpha/beta hydrolase [Polaribacter sp. IC063]
MLLPSLRIPKAVQWSFKIINFISTRFTLYLASKLLTTPITFKTPNRELGMEKASQKKILHVSAIDKDIHILSYGFSKKKILVAHGWAGRSTQLFMIANTLLEQGFMVISFDAPAHGKSTGKRTNLIEFIETIKAIHYEYGSFTAAVGHSFGAVALLNMQANKAIFKCLITIGSADKVDDIFLNFVTNLGLDSNFGEKFVDYFEHKKKLNLSDYDASNAAKKVKIPVLVIHDRIDGNVSVSCAINIRLNLKKGTLFISNELGHTKILRDKNTTHRIVNFITQNT